MAFSYQIKNFKKQISTNISSISDFELYNKSEVSAKQILANKNTSLYSLNFDTNSYVFVETPADVNLNTYPFYYLAQYENASSVYEISFSEFDKLDYKPENTGKLIHIYSTGRCGSTLLSNVFKCHKNCQVFSEPDVFAQLNIYRAWDKSKDTRVKNLLLNCTNLLLKNIESINPLIVIKYRSFSIELADLFHEVFPVATNLFMYRDAVNWVKSANRAFANDSEEIEPYEYVKKMAQQSQTIHTHLHQGKPFSTPIFSALIWLSAMETYIRLTGNNIPFAALNYNQILNNQQQSIESLLSYCQLDKSNFENINLAFKSDSQKGTSLEKSKLEQSENTLNTNFVKEYNEFISTRPVINNINPILPNTLK